MAHGLLEYKVNKEGLDVLVDSAGTSNYHIEEKPDNRAISKMAEYGIDISSQKARQFVASDIDDFDMVFAMDYNNYNDIQSVTESKPQNLQMIMNLVYPNENMSVPDPYWSGDDGFENVYKLLDRATDQIIDLLKDAG